MSASGSARWRRTPTCRGSSFEPTGHGAHPPPQGLAVVYVVALGVGLAIAGLLLITFRPRANPLFGRVLMALGALVIAGVLWQIVQEPSFIPGR